MNPRPPMQLVDYVRELTEPHTHAEHYTVRRGGTWYGHNHITKVPPLIAQLWANDIPSAAVDTGMRPGFGSKPAARLDALDAAARIDHDAQRWVIALGGHVPVVADSIDLVRRLNGLAAGADPTTRAEITRDVRSWWTQARIVTGWDSPAWSPDNTCPQCGERGTLKVRLAEGIGMCTNDACRVTWATESIGLLADHIRLESAAEREPRTATEPCYCPLPRPHVDDLDWLCPRCGSARCTHALRARLVSTIRRRETA